MKISRRTFLNKSTAAAGIAALSPKSIFAALKPQSILGIQLYSVRDDMSKDPLATIKAIAAAGYKYVEHANYSDRKFYGYSATDFKKLLDDIGLQMKSGHTVMANKHWNESQQDFTDEWKYTVQDAATVGQQYVISPWLDESMRKNIDDFKRYMNVFNKSGELCKQSGMKFGYHNHDFEFTVMLNGEKLYDLILKNTDPALVAQQIDIGNMYGVGGRALEYIQKYPGRFELMHVKDEIKAEGGEMGDGYESTVLGKGVLPLQQILSAAKQNGTVHFIVEQESYQGKTPLECAKEDYVIMKQWGY